jgi:hypothetical protein
MCPTLSAVFDWLRTNQQSLAIWLEGLALVAIFGLELAEYKRQGRERKDQHEESAAQMRIAKDAATAAKASADAVLNSERAWIEISLGPWEKDPWDTEEDEDNVFFVCSIQIKNHGRTIARVESVQVGADTVGERLPPEPLNFTTSNLHSLLGSGQKQTVRIFDAESAFPDGVSIVNGTKRGILRIIVKYRDVVDASILHETSVLYVFQNSLEDELKRFRMRAFIHETWAEMRMPS